MNEPPDLLFLLRRIEGRLGRIEDRLTTIERDIVRLSHEAAGTHSECRDIRHRLTRVEQKLGLHGDSTHNE
jgi:archaellum component FlaC